MSKTTPKDEDLSMDANELVECSVCHRRVPRSEVRPAEMFRDAVADLLRPSSRHGDHERDGQWAAVPPSCAALDDAHGDHATAKPFVRLNVPLVQKGAGSRYQA